MRNIITNSTKIICVGLNYHDHAIETKKDLPNFPIFFVRYPSSIVQNNNIILSSLSNKFDYEAELAVVIGKQAKNINRANAYEYIAGYTIFNDVTARDYQAKSSQWFLGKNFDNSGAIGPNIVEISPEIIKKGLNIQTKLNGMIMQNSNSNQMIFAIDELIEIITASVTLEAGDVIATGTPAGVGFARNPPIYLQHNDSIEIEINKIGILKNICIRK